MVAIWPDQNFSYSCFHILRDFVTAKHIDRNNSAPALMATIPSGPTSSSSRQTENGALGKRRVLAVTRGQAGGGGQAGKQEEEEEEEEEEKEG